MNYKRAGFSTGALVFVLCTVPPVQTADGEIWLHRRLGCVTMKNITINMKTGVVSFFRGCHETDLCRLLPAVLLFQTLCALCRISSAAITFTSTVKPIPGDLNLNGSVDFVDFLLFASNYGKTGPAPTALPAEPQIVYIRDTVVVRDTVRVVVRDTVYLSSTPPPSQPSAPVRGSNANAVSSLDLVGIGGGVVGNGNDDKVVKGTVSGRGTRIVVEVFASGVTTALSGASAVFDIDTRLVRIVSVKAPSIFPLVLPHYDATATVGAFAPGLPPNGLLMTVTFETLVDVTGIEFSIGLQSLDIAVSPTDRDILTTGRIAFNASGSANAPGTPGAFSGVLRSPTTVELRWSAPIQSRTTYVYRVSTNRAEQISDPSNTTIIHIP